MHRMNLLSFGFQPQGLLAKWLEAFAAVPPPTHLAPGEYTGGPTWIAVDCSIHNSTSIPAKRC